MNREDQAKYAFDPGAPTPIVDAKSAEWLKVGTQFRAIKHSLTGESQANYEAIWRRLRAEFHELRDLEMTPKIAFNGNFLAPAELRFGLVKLLRCYVEEGVEITPMALRNLLGGKPQNALSLFEERRAA